jgi:hypothetical protein
MGAGMPLGNGDTTALIFPLHNTGQIPGLARPCTDPTKFVDGFCPLGDYIGCHDTSCQIAVNGSTEHTCTDPAIAICNGEAATACIAAAGCAAFSVLNDGPANLFQLFKEVRASVPIYSTVLFLFGGIKHISPSSALSHAD